MFCDILIQLRRKAGYSQAELGKLLNRTHTAISMYEQGNRMPDYETMKQISELFNVSMDYLYEKEKPTDDGELSENKRKLIEWARTVPEDKVDSVLQALQSILAILQ
jgi:transcriptional regulator with XRE-family HTH domain